MDDETRARRDRCRTFLSGDGNVPPAELLLSVGERVVPDTYGEGGVVAELESMVAELLGFPAAVFLPSGTMAQAATIQRRDVRTAAPSSAGSGRRTGGGNGRGASMAAMGAGEGGTKSGAACARV